MTISAQGRKKSNFPVVTTVPAGATLDFVSGSTNYKITKANFITEMGATGSLTAVGASGRTDILTGSGSAYEIRGLEDGAGITCSVSGDDGIEVKVNFTQEASYTALCDDFTVASPIIASLRGGAGISVAKASNIITITNTGPFPYGITTMQGNTTATTISVAGTPVLAAGTWVVGAADTFTPSTGGRLTYTGADDYVATIDASVTILRAVGTGEIDVTARIYKNGATVAASEVLATCSDTLKANLTLPYKLSLSQNDYIEIYVTNEDGTDNITVTDAIFRVV